MAVRNHKGERFYFTTAEVAAAQMVSQNDQEPTEEEEPETDTEMPLPPEDDKRTWKESRKKGSSSTHPFRLTPDDYLTTGEAPQTNQERPRKRRKNRLNYKRPPKPDEATCRQCGNLSHIFCRLCGDMYCQACSRESPEGARECPTGHLATVGGGTTHTYLTQEQTDALASFSGIDEEFAFVCNMALDAWRETSADEFPDVSIPASWNIKRRPYTSQHEVPTEEEFWAINDKSKPKDFPNRLPAEVYQIGWRYQPGDVLTSLVKILGSQLSGLQVYKERESMSRHMRDHPKLTLGIFEFDFTRSLVCPKDRSLLPNWRSIPPQLVARNSASVTVCFNSAGLPTHENVLKENNVRELMFTLANYRRPLCSSVPVPTLPE